MAAINFDDLFEELTTGVETIAKDSLKNFEQEAAADGKQALDDIKINLQQWTKELETGSITGEDMGCLLREEEALTKMRALKQNGLAAIHIDEFRNNIINMVVGKVTGLIKV